MFYLGLIVAICSIPGITGASIPTQWAVLSCVLPLGLWREGVLGPATWAGLATLAWSAASFTWAWNLNDAAFGLWTLSILGLAFWLGSTILDFRPLLRGLALGLIASSILAIIQALGFTPILGNPGPSTGLFYNNTVLGAVTALAIIALASHRLWLWIPPLLPSLWLAQSRGAWVALAAAFAARILPWYLLCLGGIAGFIALAYSSSSSDLQRLMLWGVALREFNLFGHGIGSFNTYLFYNPTELYRHARGLFHPEFVHNDYIQLWFELGIGALGIYAIYALCLSRTESPQWPTFLAFAILGLFYFPLYHPLTAFIGCVFAGRIAGDWHVYRRYSHSRGLNQLSWPAHQGPSAASPSREALPLVAQP